MQLMSHHLKLQYNPTKNNNLDLTHY